MKSHSRIINSHGLALPSLIAALVAVLLVSTGSAFPQATAFDPDRSRKLIKQADKMYRQASYSEAEKILRDVVASDPDNSLAKLKLAHVMLKSRQIVEAFDLALPVATAQKDDPYALAVMGSILISAGRLKDARPILQRSLQLNKREALAWANFGMLDFYENNIEEAVLNLREAVLYESNHADYIFALAQVTARAERYSESADAYQRFLEISRDTDDDRRARIRGLITFLRFLGSRSSLYGSTGADSTTIPIELRANRPIMKLRINGKREPLSFVLDTGSGISVISEETAKRLGIKPVTRGGFARGIGGDGTFEIVYGFLREVEIGEVRVRNVPVYIRKFHSTSNQVDGYVGLSVISKFITTVDYGDLTFSIEKHTEENALKADSVSSLPLRLTSSGFLSGEVALDGLANPVNFIVDTGASISVISNELASVDTMNLTELPQRMRVIGAAGVTENVRTFMLPKISFGEHTRTMLSAISLDLGLINEASGFEQGGILGGNFLKGYKLIFDFRNARVIFDPINERADDQSLPLE